MAGRILRIANGIVSFFEALMLIAAGLYASYALWDNHQIYSAAEEIQADLLRLKPVVSEGEEQKPSFSELLALNPDVCAWLTMDGTQVDYPVLQGETNLTYINTDVYGEFALAGSIFLDTRCDRNFGDHFSLVYGHHMDRSRMFGDLYLYKDTEFFEEHDSGVLMLPGEVCDLQVFACLVAGASDDAIFQPEQWSEDMEGLLDYTQEKALQLREEVLRGIRQSSEEARVIALSTCSNEFTDARTVVLCRMAAHQDKAQNTQ